MNYWISRFIYCFSAVFFFPALIFFTVNLMWVGIPVVMALGAGWGFGWVWQDMHKPTPRRKPGDPEDSYDHLFF